MEPSRKAGIIALVAIGVAIFGYAQYASASHISVNMAHNELLSTDGDGSDYYIELEFENPSLLVLTAGQTEFVIESDGRAVGQGVLEPFTLTPLEETTVSGTYHTPSGGGGTGGDASTIRISGSTEYDVLFASIGIPFEYYPTDEQARDFIHQS